MVFTLNLFFSQSYAQVHDNAHWIGEIYESADKKYEVRVQHLLRGTTLPESEKWVALDPPLKIKLLRKAEIKIVTATHYQFIPGCNAFPNYKIDLKEKLNLAEWSAAVPENKAAKWAQAFPLGIKLGSPLKEDELADYHWERLYDKLAYKIIKEFPSEKKEELIVNIRKRHTKNVQAVYVDKRLSLIFVDISFSYSHDEKNKKTFTLHRTFKNSKSGGVDEVAPTYASEFFYGNSYVPNQPFYSNLDGTHLFLRKEENMYQSVYFLVNFHGVIIDHGYSLGEEDCD